MKYKSLAEIHEIAKQKKTVRLAVAVAEDEEVLEAVCTAAEENIVDPILIGNRNKIKKIAQNMNIDNCDQKIINVPDKRMAVSKAISLINEGEAEILMKGLVSTALLMKAVVNHEGGLKNNNTLLSHIAIFEIPHYHKLLCITDAGMNIDPGFEEKVIILNNAVEVFHKLGTKKPKVAVIGSVENINPEMEATVHAAMLTMMNKRHQIKGCIVDGPLALDNAVSAEAARHKGITSEVAGDADIILVPEIDTGNVLYKSLNFLGGATCASLIMGAKVPIVLTSRADSEKSKLMSIALAACIG